MSRPRTVVEIRATATGGALLRLLDAAAAVGGAAIHCHVEREPGSVVAQAAKALQEAAELAPCEPAWDAVRARDAYRRDGHAMPVLAEETGLWLGRIDELIFEDCPPTADEARKLNRALGLGGAS